MNMNANANTNTHVSGRGYGYNRHFASPCGYAPYAYSYTPVAPVAQAPVAK